MAGRILYTLAPSHYCERARWGLESAGIGFTERVWAPGLHAPLARRIAPGTSLPILADGTDVVQGSDAILGRAGFARTDAELEHRFEGVIGPLLRRWIYSGTLHVPGSGVREMLLTGVPAVQALPIRLGWRWIRPRIAARVGAAPERATALRERLERELDWADGLVGHRLGGDLGRSEITAASLLAPLARPDAMPVYRRLHLPADMEATFARWSERPILRWVLATYRTHRHDAAAPESRLPDGAS